MLTMKWLLCAACLCGASVFAKAAMLQDAGLSGSARLPQDSQRFEFPAVLGSSPGNLPPGAATSRDLFPNESAALPTGADDIPPKRVEHLPVGTVAVPSDAVEVPAGRYPSGAAQFRPRRITRNVVETVLEAIPAEELEEQKRLQSYFSQLKVADNPAARKEAVNNIEKHLTTQFERDVKRREQELAEVEKRVASLREQLEKRKQAQAEIIHLKLQTVVNSANGLGFPGEESVMPGVAGALGSEYSYPVTSPYEFNRYDNVSSREVPHDALPPVGLDRGRALGGPSMGGMGPGMGLGGPSMGGMGPGMSGMGPAKKTSDPERSDNFSSENGAEAPPNTSGFQRQD